MANANDNKNGQQPATPEKALAVQRIENIQAVITADFVQNQLRTALGDNAAAFQASIVEVYSGDKYLQECDPKQVIMECLKAAVLKLPINKQLGYAWIIPYKKIPQFQIGYKGLIQLAIRTSMYKHINCDEVYQGEYRAANKLTGEFDLSGNATNQTVVGFFAYFELHNSFSKTLYMTKEKVEAHGKKYSPSYHKENSRWKVDFNSMAKKTVLRLLLTHWGYMSVELASVMAKDPDFDAADEVMDEIKGKGNIKTTGFEEADLQHGEMKPAGAIGEGDETKPPF